MAYHNSTTCDRCQREIHPGTGSYVAAPRDVYLIEPRYDICDHCKIDLKRWLTAPRRMVNSDAKKVASELLWDRFGGDRPVSKVGCWNAVEDVLGVFGK